MEARSGEEEFLTGRKERRGGWSNEKEGAMRKRKQQRGRGNEEGGAIKREERRGGRNNEDGATRRKERRGERSLLYPSVNERNEKLKKQGP